MSNTLRCLIVVGTRPEAIKLAPVIIAMKKSSDFEPVVVATAQHREMLDQALNLFDIRPDYDLNVMRPQQSLCSLTSRVLLGLEPVLAKEKPDWVIVQGDTTTAFAGALAGFYAHVPVAHVEAGLRTRSIASPFPEEANRRLITRLAAVHFAPTKRAAANLLAEGVPAETVHVTGNTAIDALYAVLALHGEASSAGVEAAAASELTAKSAKAASSAAGSGSGSGPGSGSGLAPGPGPGPGLAPGLGSGGASRMLLVTTHRRENWGKPLEQVYHAILDILEALPDVWVLFPCHRNPVVREAANRILGAHPRVKLTDPLDYRDFVHALQAATLVLSDSGGVQEEAPALRKPVLVLREETERQEAVEAGTARLVGTDRVRIREEALALLTDRRRYEEMANAGGANNPFGDGHASERILAILRSMSMHG
ncbi:MAG: UDP-N-acetylglucosamine 2-epimerase (non-hydrolyzing) [Limnochordales bacterium]|nr:UDP-N-acetylglucosamine 2-epimerase (non-hydrolyzing) [Limnochordales bacterium]